MAWWAFEGFSVSVAGSDCGDGSSITAGVELGHGGFGEVAAVGDLPFVVHVGQHSADEGMTAGSLGKIPTTRARRLISLFTRSRGLVDQIWASGREGRR